MPADREVLVLDVAAHLVEVALHRLPGAARRDPHLLVVVAGGPARGEPVAEPEAVLGRDLVGEIGEGRGALVGRHHQIRIVLVVTHHVGRRHHRRAHDVVGEIEQAADEGAVALDHLGLPGVAIVAGRQPLGDEAALGADRDDHRVLHHLRLHQAQDLGAEVLAPVGEPDAAARDLAAAQMNALDPRRVDEDLVARARQRQERELARLELDRQVGMGAPSGSGWK